jgi:hypothetical protein
MLAPARRNNMDASTPESRAAYLDKVKRKLAHF